MGNISPTFSKMSWADASEFSEDIEHILLWQHILMTLYKEGLNFQPRYNMSLVFKKLR